MPLIAISKAISGDRFLSLLQCSSPRADRITPHVCPLKQEASATFYLPALAPAVAKPGSSGWGAAILGRSRLGPDYDSSWGHAEGTSSELARDGAAPCPQPGAGHPSQQHAEGQHGRHSVHLLSGPSLLDTARAMPAPLSYFKQKPGFEARKCFSTCELSAHKQS